jgi:hypothetical protein
VIMYLKRCTGEISKTGKSPMFMISWISIHE